MKFKHILASCVLAASLAGVADTHVKIDGIYYDLSTRPYGTDGTYQASVGVQAEGSTAKGDEVEGEITIPDFITYEGTRYAVTALGYRAFYDQAGVTAVNAPETLQKIDSYAFMRTAISSFIIPEHVESLGMHVFRSCSNLTELVCLNPVPPSVTSDTFANLNFSGITLYVPRGCIDAYKKASGWSSFTNMEEYADTPIRPTSLEITPHNLLGLIGESYQLTAVVTPEDATNKTVKWSVMDPTVATVDDNGLVTMVAYGQTTVFAVCEANQQANTSAIVFAIEPEKEIDGIAYRFNLDYENDQALATVIRKSSSYSGDIVIPPLVNYMTNFRVIEIDANAFALCSDLNSISIPWSMEKIGKDAFRNCTGLSSVDCYGLGYWAMIDFANKDSNPVAYSRSLTVQGTPVVRVNIDGSLNTIKPFMFEGLSTLTEVTLGEGITAIEQGAFMNCDKLASITLPSSMTKVGLSAFQNCSSLTSLTLNDGLTEIAGGAFGSTGISSVVIPEGIEVIDNQAFMNCGSLETVVLPSTLQKLMMMVFNGCPVLSLIECNAVTPPEFFTYVGDPTDYSSNFMEAIFPTCVLEVPEESVEAYKAAAGWKNFATIRGPQEPLIEELYNGLHYALDPQSKTASLLGIGFRWDYDYEMSYDVPEGFDYEGQYYTVTSVAPSAFEGEFMLINITLPDCIETIGARAFAGSGIRLIKVPQSVTQIPDECFMNCKDLISVGLPDHLLNIGIRAFYGSERIRFIRSVNYGTEGYVPPTFSTFEGDPTNYGEAFSTEIWPDCDLMIPAGMFGNYKAMPGWKNFRSWVYWHDTDIATEELLISPENPAGKTGESIDIYPYYLPADATYKKIILVIWEGRDLIDITPKEGNNGAACWEVSLKEEGEVKMTAFNGLVSTDINITITEDGCVSGVETGDESPRYFNLQGVEIAAPAPGQPCIEVTSNRSKVILR